MYNERSYRMKDHACRLEEGKGKPAKKTLQDHYVHLQHLCVLAIYRLQQMIVHLQSKEGEYTDYLAWRSTGTIYMYSHTTVPMRIPSELGMQWGHVDTYFVLSISFHG